MITTLRQAFSFAIYFGDALSADVFLATGSLYIFYVVVKLLSDKDYVGKKHHIDHQIFMNL